MLCNRSMWFALALMIGMAGCGGSESPGTDRSDVAEGDVGLGETVTLEGIVNESYGDAAFEMAGDGVLGRFGEGAEVLVVGDDLPSTAAGANVRVTGKVVRYEPADLADQAKDSDVDLPDKDDYDRAIVANEVTVLDPSGTYDR